MALPTHTPRPGQPQTVRGIVAGRAKNGSLLVRVPSYGNALSEAHTPPLATSPRKGDEALLAYDERGDPWVLAVDTPGPRVEEWGARADPTFDSSDAINRAIKEQPKGPTGGGRLIFDSGFYLCEDTLHLNNTVGISLEGQGGLGLLGLRAGEAPYGATVLLLNGAQGMDVGRTVGFTMRHMGALAFVGEYTGNLIDFTSPNGEPAVRMHLDHVTLQGPQTPHETALLDLTNAVSGKFESFIFIGADSCLLGRREPGHFSTTHLFQSGIFEGAASRLTGNAHQAWTFKGCAFEQLFAGGLPAGAGGYSEYGGCIGQGLSFEGCWFGDSTLVGSHIATAALNLKVDTCLMNGADSLVNITAETIGVEILNNKMENAHKGIVLGAPVFQPNIRGNTFLEVTTPIVNPENAKGGDIQGGAGGIETLTRV